jgi:hypothetical protein
LVKNAEKLPSPYFRVDEVVSQTGVYRVFHSGHRVSHEALLLRDTRFPRCSQCGDSVHFEFISPVDDIENDLDFLSRRVFEIDHPAESSAKRKLA